MGEEPKLVSRRDHKKSTFVLGRTIGAEREHPETKNERAAARKKDKQKKTIRLVVTVFGFIVLIAILIILLKSFLDSKREEPAPEIVEPATVVTSEPTIEIIDESASATGGKITSRMKEYIGQLEADLKAYGLNPTKAVISRDAIREVDFYLDGYTGYIKTVIDRGAGVTAEDADRMLRYLAEQGITDFEYIDLRISGRAFWK